MSLMRLRRAVDSLLASRASARTAALLRLAVAAAGFLVWLEEVPVFIRLTDSAVLRVPYVPGLQPPSGLFVAVATMWLVALVALALGLWSRIAAGTLAGVLVVTLLADQQLYSNHLYLLLIVVILIGLADADASLTLNARGQVEPETVAGWPIGLLRLQVSIVYAFSALAKLNPTYLSGTVMGAYLRDTGPLAVPQEWRGFQLLFALSLIGILVEAFLAVALWLPRWRRTAFLAGLALHTGIAAWLEPTTQLITFGVLILPLYLTFLNPEPRAIVVVWDDACSFCRGWITWARRLDWLHALRLVPASDANLRSALRVSEADALDALQVVAGARRSSGYDGLARIAEVLPISFLWAAILRLPPIAAVGRRVYRRVAARRRCGVGEGRAHAHATSDSGAADVPV